MSGGALPHGLIGQRPFICISCRVLRLSQPSARSRSLAPCHSRRSYATSTEPSLDTTSGTKPKKSDPASTRVKKLSPAQQRFFERKAAAIKAAKKAKVEANPKKAVDRKAAGRKRRSGIVRRVIAVKGVPLRTNLNDPTRHKNIEDIGESLEKSLNAGKNLKRRPKTVLEAKHLKLDVIDVERPPVPRLANGLSRVLFNPGVAQVRDPRSRVLNFDPHLEKLMPVRDFDFDTLNLFTPPSKDQTLANVAKTQRKKYVASTSSMTGVLKHFHFLLSNWRPINFSMLSKAFPVKLTSYTKMTRSPDAIFLKWKDGVYAVDSDKMYDSANVLSLMGRYMEKLLTLDQRLFKRHKVGSEDQISQEERQEPEAFHYSTVGDFVLRSQLDAYDERLPGTGMFDLKTRAVIPIRMDSGDFEWGMDYEIRALQGEWQSFEREYHDMIRSTMLKYSLQVRMGRMDGIFVAFHNIARIFGFQYVSLDEMDHTLHGQWDRTLGDQEFLASLKLMNEVFNKATENFPEQNIRFHFETRETSDPFMYIFAEPVSEEMTDEIQNTNKARIRDWEKSILSPKPEEDENNVTTNAEEPPNLDEGAAAAETFQNHASAHYGAMPATEQPSNATSTAVEVGDAGGDNPPPEFQSALDDPTNTSASGPSNSQVQATPDLGKIISAHASDVEATASSSGMKMSEETTAESSSYVSVEEAAELDALDDTSASGNAAFLSALHSSTIPKSASSGSSSPPSEDFPPLLAFQLHTQHHVNSRQVPRPPNPFTAVDEWAIHHTLAPIESPARAWTLYNACKARRHKEMSEEARLSRGDDEYFKNLLRRITAEGKTWREDLEKSEREAAQEGSVNDVENVADD